MYALGMPRNQGESMGHLCSTMYLDYYGEQMYGVVWERDRMVGNLFLSSDLKR